jgi:hypothetical protein
VALPGQAWLLLHELQVAPVQPLAQLHWLGRMQVPCTQAGLQTGAHELRPLPWKPSKQVQEYAAGALLLVAEHTAFFAQGERLGLQELQLLPIQPGWQVHVLGAEQ